MVVNYPLLLTYTGGNIDVSFVLRSKGTFVCNSSSSVLNRTSPSLLHTFVVDTLLNLLVPFNIILTYRPTQTIRSKMFRVIDCDEDLIYFQEGLDKLHQWSQRNQMDFSTKFIIIYLK